MTNFTLTVTINERDADDAATTRDEIMRLAAAAAPDVTIREIFNRRSTGVGHLHVTYSGDVDADFDAALEAARAVAEAIGGYVS